ncbi:antitoxin VbhA family protein [Stenotrophomonas sp. NPDC078853]|uniref:antitoxin VbhA family protein n=1 Tax=Stenotrophomonas sp. NPDC078853 TaxID=3364534 RepID=UPI00384E7764
MSDERSRREALVAAQGSLQTEGLSFSKKGLALMESWVAGDIDSEQLRDLMLRLWSRVSDEGKSSLPG